MNKQVDLYIKNATQWQEEMTALRAILLECDVVEEIKWGKPAYTNGGKVIVVIQAFKQYFALLFYKGYLLDDEKKLLQTPGPNTKVSRQMRFENVAEIKKLQTTIKAYVNEAIQKQL